MNTPAHIVISSWGISELLAIQPRETEIIFGCVEQTHA